MTPESTPNCGKKTNNPFFNFLRCYRTRPDRQHKTAVENAIKGAREWNKMNEEQRKPFVEMAKPFLKPENELKYPRRASPARKPRRRRRTARSTTRTKRSTGRSRSGRRGVKSRATSRGRRGRKTTTKRRTRSTGSRSRRRTKRRTQSCAKAYTDQINQQQIPLQTIKTEKDDSSMHPSTNQSQHQPTPAPCTSPVQLSFDGTSSACECRNRLSKGCETAMETLNKVTHKLDKACKDCDSFGHVIFNECSRNKNDCSCPCCLPSIALSSSSSSSGIHVNCDCKKIFRNFQKTSK